MATRSLSARPSATLGSSVATRSRLRNATQHDRPLALCRRPAGYDAAMVFRRPPMIVPCLLLAACTDGSARDQAWDPPTASDGGSQDVSDTLGADSSVDETSADPGTDPGADDAPTVDSGEATDPAESSGGYDCKPWATQWIGGPCLADGDCTYDGGVCLREDEGFRDRSPERAPPSASAGARTRAVCSA